MARGAVSNHVEGMRGCPKALLLGELIDHRADRALEVARRCHVNDSPAQRAQQVVMMVREVFSQLETCELVVGRDASHDAGVLEI